MTLVSSTQPSFWIRNSAPKEIPHNNCKIKKYNATLKFIMWNVRKLLDVNNFTYQSNVE